MPRHYAEDVNTLRGEIHFDNTKIAFVYFKNSAGEQVSFTKRPFVSLTVLDQTSQPALRMGWIKSGNLFIGCKIRFAANFTGDVDWEVRE